MEAGGQDSTLRRGTEALGRWLLSPEDPAGLTVFRFLLGSILTWDISRFLVSGWVDSMFLEPALLFKYYGFSWVQPLPPMLHHALFFALAVCGVGIALGLAYRFCAAVFFVGHAYIFFLSSSHYLNHAYLICLLTFLVIAMPMDRALSVRAWARPADACYAMPRWPRVAIVAQIGVVYVYGAIAKINTDWLVYHMPIRRWLAKAARDAPLGGEIIGADWFVPIIAWGGFWFDLLIFPALLWRRSRPVAIVLSAAFHLTNAFLFNIGVFPWLMLAMTTLFFEPSWPRRLPWAGPRLATMIDRGHELPVVSRSRRRLLVGLLALWFVIQFLMPLRHHLYSGNVAWTEQGHLYSWRMKLRSKRGRVAMRVRDPATGKEWVVDPAEHLTKRQVRKMGGRPELIMQYAHFLADHYRDTVGIEVAVNADAWVSLNYRRRQRLVHPEVDLSKEEMRLGPYPWILPLSPTPPPKD